MDESSPIPAVTSHFDTSVLFASLLWGSIGAGFCIYGKKQGSAPALIGGVALVAVSYFVGSTLWMSVCSLGILAGVFLWSRSNWGG
jgi:hypothetical protein